MSGTIESYEISNKAEEGDNRSPDAKKGVPAATLNDAKQELGAKPQFRPTSRAAATAEFCSPSLTSEESLRCQLAAAYRIAAHLRWDELIYNHITLKLPGSEELPHGPHFLINPFGMCFDEVTASSLVKVGLDGTVIDPGSGTGRVSKTGFSLHGAIHRARGEVQCVWHSHQSDCAAVSMLKSGLLPLSPEAIRFMTGNISEVPFEDFAVDQGSIEKSISCATQVLLLQNNGAMVLGQSLEDAFEIMYNFVRACTYQVKALSVAGGDVSRLSIPPGTQLESMRDRLKKNEDSKEAARMGRLLGFYAAQRTVEKVYGAAAIYS